MTDPLTSSLALAEVAQAFHEHQMAADPFVATYNGLITHRDELPDLSPDGQAAVRHRASGLRDRAEGIDPSGLGDSEQVSRLMLLDLLDAEIAHADDRWTQMGVDAFAFGPQAQLLYFLPRTDIADQASATDHVTRLSRVGTYLDQALAEHRTGAVEGRTPTIRGVQAAIAMARRTADQDPADSVLLAPLSDRPGPEMATAAQVYGDTVRPALRRYADGLQTEVLPHARPDDRAGLCWLDDGADRYQRILRRFTTLAEPDPDVIHQTGLDLVAALEQEYVEVAGPVLGVTDLPSITDRLLNDPTLRYDHPDDAVAHAQAICDRAAEQSRRFIGRLPATPCLVKKVPEVMATGAAAAFYQVAADGRDYGTYWVNTTDPVLPRYTAEVTAFHEAAPGHHTQLALQLELDLPTFRRMGTVLSGYSEGWGLYTERLCDDMGMYSGPVDRLGMLALDSVRACRLVVDTGIHHMGWSRQRAIDYMAANAPVGRDLIEAEVDRYIVLPGQACSYMVGRHEILRLRDDAQDALGDRFDLAAFHDAVLSEGAVPLTVLDGIVQRWIAG